MRGYQPPGPGRSGIIDTTIVEFGPQHDKKDGLSGLVVVVYEPSGLGILDLSGLRLNRRPGIVNALRFSFRGFVT